MKQEGLDYPRETFVVGAGFSRAAHSSMPTLAGLGAALRQQLLSQGYSQTLSERIRDVLAQGQIPLGNLEMWLSSLAERQPFMSRPEAFRNQALFDEISAMMVATVRSAQEGFWSTAPSWLHWLVRLWHRRRVNVITFNYDTIVEDAMLEVDAPGADGDIVAAILTHLPRRAVTTSWGETPSPTFRLLKLHGSLDWYWNAEDQSGESLCRLTRGTNEADARAALAGKVPFIVPPLATKTAFFSLGLIRQLWEEAAGALEAADRIVVIGYSVPLTDLATSAMFSLAARRGAEWHIVDTDPETVAERLVSLGIPRSNIQLHRAVDAWVDWYENDHAGQISDALQKQMDVFRTNESYLAPIMVRRTRGDYLLVHAIKATEQNVVLEAHERAQDEVIDESYPREPDLAHLFESLPASLPVVAQIAGVEGDHVVLGALPPKSARSAHAVLHWCPLEIQDLPRR